MLIFRQMIRTIENDVMNETGYTHIFMPQSTQNKELAIDTGA